MAKRKKKKSAKKTPAAPSNVLIACVTVLAATVVVAACLAINYISDNKISNFEGTADIYVYPDSTPDQVIGQISAQTSIRRPRSLTRTFKNKQVLEYMQAGHYRIDSKCTSAYVARMLNNCWQTPVNLTLSGTMRLKEQLASKISVQLMLDSATVRRALDDKTLLASYGFTPENVFALFIPDTYEVYWTSSVEDILAVQKKAYDAFWTEERDALARRQKLSRMQVSILASIVKGESNYQPEFPDIASVYLNRYHKGMKLQADPTIAYCYGYTLNRILKKHLTVDSPYNTYKYAGLPPAPICVPTKACLDAVLNPSQTRYLFFCADPSFNGSHRFAVSYVEHMANARAFQKALNARLAAKTKQS